MNMLHQLGRWMQILGLVIPPLSLVLWPVPVKMFASLVFSVCLFMLGRYVEGYAGR